MRRAVALIVALIVALGLVVAACSSDDGDDNRIERIDEPARVDPDADVSGG